MSETIALLRQVANGLGSLKNERGDYGLADTAADEIEALRARLEKAEAERDSAEEARLGAYEVCAVYAYCHADDRPRRYAADYNGFSMDYDDGYMDGCKGAAAAIRAISPLHASPPTPDQGDGA